MQIYHWKKNYYKFQVRRGFGPLAANRRIGPELSKKIYTFFTDNTGCTTISQE